MSADRLFFKNTALINSNGDTTVSAVMPHTGNVLMSLGGTVMDGTGILKISKDGGTTTLAVAGATLAANGTAVSTEPVPQGALLEFALSGETSTNIDIDRLIVQQLDLVDTGENQNLLFWTNPEEIIADGSTLIGTVDRSSKVHFWTLGLTATTYGTAKLQWSLDGGTTKVDLAGATMTAADYKISTGFVPQGASLYFDLAGEDATTLAIGTIIVQQDSESVALGEGS